MWLEASNHSCHIWQLCDRPLYSRSFYNVLKFKPTRVLNYTLFSPSFAFLFVRITVYLPLVSILPTEVKLNYIYMSCLPGGPGTWFSERTLKKKKKINGSKRLFLYRTEAQGNRDHPVNPENPQRVYIQPKVRVPCIGWPTIHLLGSKDFPGCGTFIAKTYTGNPGWLPALNNLNLRQNEGCRVEP